MNEEDFGLHRSDTIGEQGETPRSSSQQVHEYHQQQTPPYTDNGNYQYYDSQQQGPYEGCGNSQFGVLPKMSGGFYDGYHGGQQYVIPEHIGNQFDSPTHMDWGYYGEEPPYEGYYNTQSSSPVNMNYGYYGRAQNAIDQKSDIFVDVPNTNSSYYSGQQSSQPNSSDLFGMQPSTDAQAAAEWGNVSGMDYDEFSYHNGYYRGPVRCHSMPNLREQNLAEQPCYYEVLRTDSSYSAPTSDTHFSQNTDYAPSACLSRPPNDDFVPTSGSDCLWQSISALAGDFGPSYNTNSQINSNPTFNTDPRNSPSQGPRILNGPDRVQDNLARAVVSTNSNSALITSQLINPNIALATVGFPSRGGNPAPIHGHWGSTDCGVSSHLINTNSTLIRLLGHRRPGPQPPRWRYEDAISTASTPPSLSGSSSADEDECEEESSSSAFPGLFLRSMLQAPTIFDNLARVGAISGISAPIPHCPHILKGRCQAALGGNRYCSDRVHFKRVIHAHTDVRLGDCSFLDSCDLADKCPYIHYALELSGVSEALFDRLMEGVNDMPREDVNEILGEEIDETPRQEVNEIPMRGVDGVSEGEKEVEIKRLAENVGSMRVMDKPDLYGTPSLDFECSSGSNSLPQWIRCDIRHLDLNILGKFGAVMADPPWDIRMTLPYGTVPDQAVIDLPFQNLQNEGVFFLWCTARSVDTGYTCLKTWGYEVCDEVAWIKVDHLKRLISVGRTGHWLNHTMEHCLVGVKGDPEWIKRGRGTNIIVSQPRATSHKPDQIYELIERLVGPHTRKLEIFGREHNIRKGWITLGNQLPNTYLWEEKVKKGLVKDLSRRCPGSSYTDWNPWAQGFNRYGYGKPRDWRDERRFNSNYGRYKARTSKGGNGSGGGCGGSQIATPSDVQNFGQGYDSYDYASLTPTTESFRRNETIDLCGVSKCSPLDIHTEEWAKGSDCEVGGEDPQEWDFTDQNEGSFILNYTKE